MKEKITITVFKEDATHDIPEKIDDFINFWTEKFNLIPEKYLSSAHITIEAATYYGDPALVIDIYYSRPETDEEEKKREHRMAENAKFIEIQELQQLEVLREKYGV